MHINPSFLSLVEDNSRTKYIEQHLKFKSERLFYNRMQQFKFSFSLVKTDYNIDYSK